MKYSLKNNLDKDESKAVWKILCACNNDFIPPLSSRFSTSDILFEEDNNAELPKQYFESIIDQNFILVKDTDNKVIGFLSFINGYSNQYLLKFSPSNYISTICIDPNYRGLGIGTELYNFMEQNLPLELTSNFITIRTWSTNFTQLKMLEKRKYRLVKEIKNHRGEGISSLYFIK